MIFDGYLLVSDLDHTLVEKGEICPRSVDAIKYFVANGGKFTVATGRHWLTAKPYYDATGSNCPAITFGSLVYDIENRKPVWYGPIKDSTKQICREHMDEFPETGVIIYTLEEIFITRNNAATEHFAEIVGSNFISGYTDVDSIMDKEWVKVIFADLNVDRILEMEERALSRNYKDYQGVRSEPHLYEVNSGSEFSKGTALLCLAEYLGISPEKACAIGDFYNDVPMLQCAGISATVADAFDDIKEMVDFVGGRCQDGAVADFIEYIENTAKEK